MPIYTVLDGRRFLTGSFLAVMAALACSAAVRPIVDFRTQSATFGVDEKGMLCALSRNADGRNYLASSQPAPLLSVRIGGRFCIPDARTWEARH